MNASARTHAPSLVLLFSLLAACGSTTPTATVSIKNDFNNPALQGQPPWTFCKVSYLGADFGQIALGATSPAKTVTPGLDYVLMVAAFNDATCSVAHSLPIATANQEEVVDGQTRTIAINLPNHQGPCPPQGVPPIPQAQYDRILKLWPELNFQPYATRDQNPQCK